MGKTAEQIKRAGRILKSAGVLVIRYGLVVILVWIGALSSQLMKLKESSHWSPTVR